LDRVSSNLAKAELRAGIEVSNNKLEEFQTLLFQGVLTAFRLLPLDDLVEHRISLVELELPDEIAEFPIKILDTVIAEKQTQRALN